jgi:hypothetical protein
MTNHSCLVVMLKGKQLRVVPVAIRDCYLISTAIIRAIAEFSYRK